MVGCFQLPSELQIIVIAQTNTQMKKIKVAIADDHTLFRKGMITLLETFSQLEVSIEAEDGHILLQKIAQVPPDVVLLDMDMPTMGGAEVIKHLHRDYPEVKIIIVSMHDESEFILQSLELGANSYLLKNAEPDEVVVAIETVVDEGFFFNDFVAKVMHQRIARTQHYASAIHKKNTTELTKREIEVLKLICQEYSTKEISDKLFRSERTIEGHRQNLIDKIGAKNVAGLVVYAIKHGIFKP